MPTFLTTQGHGGPPRMSDQPNAGATSETAHTWKTVHTKRTFSHPNKADMEWWLWRPNDTRGPWRPKVSWHLSYRLGKSHQKKKHPGNLSRPGIEPGPAAWQVTMLPLDHSGGLFIRGWSFYRLILKNFDCDLTQVFFYSCYTSYGEQN